jgi:putative phosphoesterase
MRIGLLSDIHGNLPAFAAVLAELQQESLDQLVCLGDVAIFGPQPRETLAALHTLACPLVMGNTDAWALDPQPHPERDADSAKFNAVELWGAAQLSADDRTFIRTFQPAVTIELGEGMALLCYHGSPRSYHDPIRATTPEDELAGYLGGARAMILAGGHTHEPFVRRFRDQIVLNPGSVGLPFETLSGGRTRNPPWAEYAILEVDDGNVRLQLRRTPVDVGAICRAAQQSGMPFFDWWLADWLPVTSMQ